MRRVIFRRTAAGLMAALCSGWCVGQTLKPRPPAGTEPKSESRRSQENTAEVAAAAPVIVPMSVPAGTPIKVALDSEVRVRKVGQPIHGITTEPVYAFDKLLIPVGTSVNGKVSGIDRVPKKSRATQAFLSGNFSPRRNVRVQFDELEMADGRQVAMQTVALPTPDGLLKFVSANEKADKKTEKNNKKNKVENAASKEVAATRDEARRQLSELRKRIHEPGKMHKVKRFVVGSLPVHPQYIEAGTSFNADLQQPLDFGTEAVKLEALTKVGGSPPTGSVVHARLLTPLSSLTAKQGDPVEALITEPLVVSDHLILPEGSVIKGSVMQAQPARRLARNGQLRILFHQVAPPNGVQQKVEASLEGVSVAKGEHLKLDAEGGAQVTTPRTRYLTTGIAVMLAASQASPDRDAGQGGASIGEAGKGAANGGFSFGFLGMVVGLMPHARAISAGMGAYGAANLVYDNFLGRGRDVVYPKDMAMVIGLGTREQKSGAGF